MVGQTCRGRSLATYDASRSWEILDDLRRWDAPSFWKNPFLQLQNHLDDVWKGCFQRLLWSQRSHFPISTSKNITDVAAICAAVGWTFFLEKVKQVKVSPEYCETYQRWITLWNWNLATQHFQLYPMWPSDHGSQRPSFLSDWWDNSSSFGVRNYSLLKNFGKSNQFRFFGWGERYTYPKFRHLLTKVHWELAMVMSLVVSYPLHSFLRKSQMKPASI